MSTYGIDLDTERLREYAELAIGNPMPPRMLWHYTSRSALLQIVETGVLWASDLRFLNDSRELSHGREIVLAAIEERIKSSSGPMETLLRAAGTAIGSVNLPGVRAVSFSETGDQLGQWRAYGVGGGVAIGLPTVRHEHAQRPAFEHFNWDNGCFYAKVIYDVEEQRRRVNRILDAALPRLASMVGGTMGTPEEREFQSFARGLSYIMAAAKDPAFSEEKEWRLCDFGDPPEGSLKFRASKSLIVPYRYLKIEKDLVAQLQVRIGPCPDPDKVKMGVAMALGIDNRSTRVHLSTIPYRDW